MNIMDQIKEIRLRLHLSQAELAAKLGVSFATVNRWENGRCEPSKIAVNAIKNLCAENDIDFSQLEGTSIITSNEIVTLYHGSKSGLKGPIAPISRDRCDFGKGFKLFPKSRTIIGCHSVLRGCFTKLSSDADFFKG